MPSKKKQNILIPGSCMAVVAVDQSLFAVVKYTQWQWVEIDNEKQIILIFGGLNLNKALWRTKGDFS